MGQLLLVAMIALASFWAGWWFGREDGHREAMRWRDRVDGMAELITASRFDEPGSPRLN